MKDKITAYFMKRTRVVVATAGIIQKSGKVLLTKRAKALPEGGKWALPGGHVDKWEKSEDTITREVKEEIGLDVVKSKLLFVQEEFLRKIDVHSATFIYELSVKGKVNSNWEVSDVGWFSKEEVRKMDLAFTHNEILDRYWRDKK